MHFLQQNLFFGFERKGNAIPRELLCSGCGRDEDGTAIENRKTNLRDKEVCMAKDPAAPGISATIADKHGPGTTRFFKRNPKRTRGT